MRFWLLILLVGTLNATEIGEISELKGNGEISRKDSTDSLIAELASDIFSFDTVKTGNGRMAVEFLDSTILKLTEHSRNVMNKYKKTLTFHSKLQQLRTIMRILRKSTKIQ